MCSSMHRLYCKRKATKRHNNLEQKKRAMLLAHRIKPFVAHIENVVCDPDNTKIIHTHTPHAQQAKIIESNYKASYG